MITLVQKPNCLEIILKKKDKKEFKESYPDLMPNISDLLDQSRYLGNGWEDLTNQMALTNADAIGYDLLHDEEGNLEINDDSTIYFYPDYMVKNPFEVLYNTGKVIFQKAS